MFACIIFLLFSSQRVYVCVSRALKRKTIFMCLEKFLTSIARSFFFHQHLQASWPKERSFLLSSSSSRDRSRMCVKENFCNFFFLYFVEKLPLSVVRRCCCFCCHIILYMSNFVCEKRRKSNDDDRNWKSTKNARDRLMFMCSLCVYIWLGSVVLEREVWRRRSTTIGDFNMKHFSNS